MNAYFLTLKHLFWLFVFSLVISGCTPPPVNVKHEMTPGLAVIVRAYENAVHQTRQDKDKLWHHGRLGNVVVNIKGDRHLGLCYHWQWQVYRAVQSVIKRTRWRALGIAINEGGFYEHHAVLVYRPDRTRFEDILEKPYKTDIYILDPWGSGKPLIYNLGNWLKLPVTLESPARLTQIKISTPPWKIL